MTYHVKDLEAGPLLDQAVLRALGAVHMQDCPEGVPDNVRERWPAEGAMVLTDEAGNMMFYGMRNIPQFSTEWGVGGPILEKEGVCCIQDLTNEWRACAKGGDDRNIKGSGAMAAFYAYGEEACQHESPSLLVAAMRSIVAVRLGDIVDLLDPFAKFGTASAVQGPPR